MRVLISDKMDPRCVEILERNRGIEVDVKAGLAPEELQAIIGEYSGLIVRSATKVTAGVLERAGRLRVVGRAGAGVDNIDVGAATRRGVIVMNTPGGNSVSTAEHSFAMLIALARNIPQATASVKAGQWERSRYTGVELQGKTLGILGLGKVGRELAARAAAFGMRVVGHDPFVTAEMADSYGARLVGLDELLASADFLSIHLPLNEQTRGLIGEAQLDRCREGVRLINCARGGIVNEDALRRALERGKVAGAALDVFEQEPPADRRLVLDERVICTPHLGASTHEAQESVALQVAEQVADALMDRVIRNAVNAPSVEPEVFRKMRPFLDLAARLGRITAQLLEGQLARITVEYHGDVTAYPTSPLTSEVLRGLVEMISSGPVNSVNAPYFVQERGIRVDELRSSEHEDYASLITVVCQTDRGQRALSGSIFGRSEPRLVRLDEYTVDAIPQGHMLLYINDDVPGIIGRVGTLMGERCINIAQMSCGRHEVGGRALTILNLDSRVPADVLELLQAQEYIAWARQVSL
ncbi:MAG: phosphoglycerate dehydrogenase [Candidatus Latescibacterota bacterium]